MPQQDKINKTDPDKRYCRVLSASTLAGDPVQNSAGEALGKVNEIMIEHPLWQGCLCCTVLWRIPRYG
jgi:hypothetical protein